jgi:uncharacterized protein YbjT (DUF2867 family)
MTPTFLIVGATGNTGRGVVRTLSERITKSPFSNHRILALTRSLRSTIAQELSRLPNVEMLEQNWTEITPEWLCDQHVVRAFIASHNNTKHFAEESTFLNAALGADVKYVVRISTTAANVRPDSKAYYSRTHWAIEAMLSTPEYERLHWTSLQPNVFWESYLGNAVELIKHVRSGGEQMPLAMFPNSDSPVAVITPDDVGIFAATLMLQADVSTHHKRKYVLNGPEDVTGTQIIDEVERRIGAKLQHQVKFGDYGFLEEIARALPDESTNVIMSARFAMETSWAGLASTKTTSKEVLELAPPKGTLAEYLDAALKG